MGGSEQQVRLEIADVLDAIATSTDLGRNHELQCQIRDLLARTEKDELLAYANAELVEYSNMIGVREKVQIENYQEELHGIAAAIRAGTSWEQYKRNEHVFETGDFRRAVERFVAGLVNRDRDR